MDLLALYAGAQPDKPAVIDDRPGQPVVSYTFSELNEQVNRIGNLLHDVGADRDTKVIWCGQNSASLICITHAIRKVSAVGVPLNYRLTSEEARYVIDNSDARIVFVDAGYEDLIAAVRANLTKVAEVFVYDGDGDFETRVRGYPPEVPKVEGGETIPATMIYTSGTTGKPKGALRTSSSLDPRSVTGLISLIGYVADDVYLTTGPLYHSGPAAFASLAHALGNTVVMQHRFDPEDWLRLVETYRVTTTFTAPTPIRRVCTLPAEVKDRYDRSSMKRLIANAAPWTMHLKKMYLADFPPDSLWEVYGSTELGVDTVLRPEDQLRKPGSCGQPAPGIEIKLFDDDGHEVTEPYEMGELYVRSATLFETYYKDEDKYLAASRGDFHTVGDIAYFDRDGYYYIADRKTDMIISGGMNIYPAEIEAVLDSSPDTYEVAVLGIPSEEWGESVHAVVVPAREGVTAEEVVLFARQHLAGFKVPRSVSFVDEIPKTGSGKVLKRQLREPFLASTPSPDSSDTRHLGLR
jgi:fatty-acyl-CoA synthase/long-chain acyl-CoA synthetase